MWKCRLISWYLTARYGLIHAITHGHMLLGHDFKYTKETVNDYWVVECTRCGIKAAIDKRPPNPEWD